MNRGLEFLPLDPAFAEPVTDLVVNAYHAERVAVPCLPEGGINDGLARSVRHLLEHGTGVMAVDGDGLLGFLAGYPVGELFGRSSGVHCPLYGHGVRGDKPLGTFAGMYRIAAGAWVGEGRMTHVITAFAHDTELIGFLYWNGFGLRCVDAIRGLEPLGVQPRNGITVRKALVGDAEVLAGIHSRHHMHYRGSPMFMPRRDEDPIREHVEWLSQENHHEWIAFSDGEPVGIMSLGPVAETFVSEHPGVMNIKGAFVEEGARGSGVAGVLLGTVIAWLRDNGYLFCGVDFESINPLASGFWMRFFTPYTHSVVRRIDERILD